jgi:acyl-coenzyme A thioesterase PaaI-like protein
VTGRTPSPPFFTRYGFSRTGDRDEPLTIDPYPEICRHGALRATVVASAVDLVGSLFTREASGDDILFTTDLSIRIPRPDRPEHLRARGELLRAGRKSVTTGVEISDAGRIFAYGQTSFTRLERPAAERVPIESLILPRELERHPLTRPLESEVGVEIVEARHGRVKVALRPGLLNAEGTLQGALVALLVEVAAESLAESHHGTPQVVSELDLRYLSTAKVGPVCSEAAWIGPPDKGMIRVELVDQGRDRRRTATALIHVEPAR